MKLHFLTLRFVDEDADLEEPFRQDYLYNNLGITRLALLTGFFVYGAFGILDGLLFTETRNSLWLIRFGLVCPMLGVAWLASWTGWFRRHWEWIVGTVVTVSGLGIVAMTVLADTPFRDTYYAGLLLVLIYGYIISRLRFIAASGTGLLILGAYEAVALLHGGTPLRVLVSNSFFLISTNALCMVASYLFERHARRVFSLMYLLDREQTNVRNSYRVLSDKVAELEAEKEKVRVLAGLIPVCADSRKARDEEDGWRQIEGPIPERSLAEFSHDLCPDCARRRFGIDPSVARMPAAAPAPED